MSDSGRVMGDCYGACEKQRLEAEIERLEEQIHALEAENHLLREELGR